MGALCSRGRTGVDASAVRQPTDALREMGTGRGLGDEGKAAGHRRYPHVLAALLSFAADLAIQQLRQLRHVGRNPSLYDGLEDQTRTRPWGWRSF
jgi:hypothetical protein